MTDRRIQKEEELEQVTGGTGNVPDGKKREFEEAWYGLGMEAKGYTGTELEDVYAQWQHAAYKPDAGTFISNCKTL